MGYGGYGLGGCRLYKLIALEQPRRGVELLAVVNGHIAQVRELAPLIFTSRSEQGDKAASRLACSLERTVLANRGRVDAVEKEEEHQEGRRRATQGGSVIDAPWWTFFAASKPVARRPWRRTSPVRNRGGAKVAHDTPRAKEDVRSPAGTALGAPAAAGGSDVH